MWEDDICVCMSKECPKYNECYRGGGVERGAGIYTMSNLGEVCSKDNLYAYFIEVRRNNNAI